MAGKPSHLRGAREIESDLRDAELLGPELRKGLSDVAGLILDTARPLVPTRSGQARASLRADSTDKVVRIAAGGTKAPYWGWLEHGGNVGRSNSVHRAYLPRGRYLYPTLYKRRGAIDDRLYAVIDRVTEDFQ